MKISELNAKGGFIGQELVKKAVSWKHKQGGEEVTEDFNIFVKRQSFGLLETVFSGNDDHAKASQMIASCIRLGDKGEEEIPYEMAY